MPASRASLQIVRRSRNEQIGAQLVRHSLPAASQTLFCAAWPVDDLASRDFAIKLYSGLLGINLEDPGASSADSDLGALPIACRNEASSPRHRRIHQRKNDLGRLPALWESVFSVLLSGFG